MPDEPKVPPLKILVVDDQEGMRLTLGGILKRHGYQVTTLENGYRAVEEVRNTRFDMIFMDIKMPGIDGVETFVRIKEIRPDVNVIMMTAFAVEDHRQSRPVLHAPAGVVPLGLGQHLNGRDGLCDALERQQRRVADQVEDRPADGRLFSQGDAHGNS